MLNTAVAALELTEAPTRQELEALQQALSANWATPEIKTVNGSDVILLSLGTDKPIDLSAAPESKEAHLHIQAQPRTRVVTLVNLGPNSVVTVSIVGLPSNSTIDTLRLRDCRGQVRVAEAAQRMRLVCEASVEDIDSHVDEVEPEEARSVVVRAGAELRVGEHLTDTVLVLDGGKVWMEARINRLAVRAGELDMGSNPTGGLIREVAVVGKAELDVGPDMPTIEKIVSAKETPFATLELRPLRQHRGSAADDLHVDVIKDVNISARSAPLRLARVKSVTGAEIHGIVRLDLREHGTVAQTLFVPVKGNQRMINPILTAAQKSFLLDVSGKLTIGEAPGIHVAAGKDALAIDVDPDAPTSDPWHGALMTNVMLPTGLVGRQMLDLLENAYHFTPATKHLPGRDQTLWAHLRNNRDVSYTEAREMQRKLYEDAEFMRELAVLCRTKGTPGSVATTVAWCSYRLRHIKASGVESAALAVYRWLGYGERPLPAFLLWALLSFALAGPVLAAGGADWDPSGVGTFLAEVGRLALGPLAGLLRGGTLSGGDLAEIAARAIISIPLVTGALALRNYVKSER